MLKKRQVLNPFHSQRYFVYDNNNNNYSRSCRLIYNILSIFPFVYLFKNTQWVPEITHHCQKTPFLLVGTQIDLRDENTTLEKLAKNKQKPITLEQGEKLARELKAVKFVECSALTQVSASTILFIFATNIRLLINNSD